MPAIGAVVLRTVFRPPPSSTWMAAFTHGLSDRHLVTDEDVTTVIAQDESAEPLLRELAARAARANEVARLAAISRNVRRRVNATLRGRSRRMRGSI
jgi:hypothetical protein